MKSMNLIEGIKELESMRDNIIKRLALPEAQVNGETNKISNVFNTALANMAKRMDEAKIKIITSDGAIIGAFEDADAYHTWIVNGMRGKGDSNE